jgi:hypothetical protein
MTYQADFIVDEDRTVSWSAELYPKRGYWEIAFTVDFLEDIIDLGNQKAVMQIFSTVRDLTERWIKEVKPGWFMFSAKEQSRQKLYMRFAKEIGRKAGYYVTTEQGKRGLEFHFKK